MESNELLEEILFFPYSTEEFPFRFELVGKPSVGFTRWFYVLKLSMKLLEVCFNDDHPIVEAA